MLLCLFSDEYSIQKVTLQRYLTITIVRRAAISIDISVLPKIIPSIISNRIASSSDSENLIIFSFLQIAERKRFYVFPSVNI